MHVGIDLGTTATKAVLVDDDGTVVARAGAGHDTIRPGDGLAEQDPDGWTVSVRAALAGLRAAAPAAFAAARGVGFSGQMHSLVALDAADRPVRPALLWNDGRGAEACAALTAAVPDVAAITGVAALPSFTAAKLVWLRDNEPDAFARTAHVLSPKDFVRLWATGERATDMSDAAGTQLFDQGARRWSPAMLAAVGLDPDRLPQLLEGIAPAGTLRAAVAAETGLPPGLPVVAGGGDTPAVAIGLGCTAPGSGFLSLGTGGVLLTTRDRYDGGGHPTIHDFAHALPGRWYHMAGLSNGAGALAWAARLVGAADVGDLLARVAARHAGPSRVMFLPYLAGDRTPHADVHLRGALFGLGEATEAVDVAQAVIEGIAFSVREADDLMAAAGGRCERPAFVGGGARSVLWGRILATLLGRPLVRLSDGDHAGALGAARLAAIAGDAAAIPTVARPPAAVDELEPIAAMAAAYEDRFALFKAEFAAAATYAAASGRG